MSEQLHLSTGENEIDLVYTYDIVTGTNRTVPFPRLRIVGLYLQREDKIIPIKNAQKLINTISDLLTRQRKLADMFGDSGTRNYCL